MRAVETDVHRAALQRQVDAEITRPQWLRWPVVGRQSPTHAEFAQAFAVDGHDMRSQLNLCQRRVHFRYPLFQLRGIGAVSRSSSVLVRLSASTLPAR